MWYVIEGYDGQDVLAQRLQARPEHLARLYALRDEGRLLLAGPCPAVDSEDPGPAGFSGSVVIAQFESLVQAQAWADADPYVAAGVYTHVQVRPFRKVLPLTRSGSSGCVTHCSRRWPRACWKSKTTVIVMQATPVRAMAAAISTCMWSVNASPDWVHWPGIARSMPRWAR